MEDPKALVAMAKADPDLEKELVAAASPEQIAEIL